MTPIPKTPARREYRRLRVGSLATVLRIVTAAYKELAGKSANPKLVADLESWRAVAEEREPDNETLRVDWRWLTSIR